MNQLVLATHNKHKAEEFQSMMAGTGIEILTLDKFSRVGDIHEDGETLEANALKKAREVFRLTSLPALGDDTGLEVHYLNEAPGIFSARYAGPTASYSDNVKKLLAALKGVPPRRRAARFRCALAFVAPGVERSVDGICRGTIIEASRGSGGFGYDSVFVPAGYVETFAEMSMEVKNTLSHRALAAQQMKNVLLGHFSSTKIGMPNKSTST